MKSTLHSFSWFLLALSHLLGSAHSLAQETREQSFQVAAYQNARELNIKSQGGAAALFPNLKYNFPFLLGSTLQFSPTVDTSTGQVQRLRGSVRLEGVTTAVAVSILGVTVKEQPVDVARELFLKAFAGGDSRIETARGRSELVSEGFQNIKAAHEKWGIAAELTRRLQRNPDLLEGILVQWLKENSDFRQKLQQEYTQFSTKADGPGFERFLDSRVRESARDLSVQWRRRGSKELAQFARELEQGFLANFFVLESAASFPLLVRGMNDAGDVQSSVPFLMLLNSLGRLVPIIEYKSARRLTRPVDLFYSQEELAIITSAARELYGSAIVSLVLDFDFVRSDTNTLVIQRLATRVAVQPVHPKTDQPIPLSEEAAQDVLDAIENQVGGDIPMIKRLPRPLSLDAEALAKVVLSQLGPEAAFYSQFFVSSLTAPIADSALSGILRALLKVSSGMIVELGKETEAGNGALRLQPVRTLAKGSLQELSSFESWLNQVQGKVPGEKSQMDELKILSTYNTRDKYLAYLQSLLSSFALNGE